MFDEAHFHGATFEQGANFRRAEFNRMARFERTAFKEWVSFRDAVFNCPAVFEHQDVEEHEGSEDVGWQHEVKFGGWADFRRARFARGAWFGGAIFESRARFGEATFGSKRDPAGGYFDGARFILARTLGPMLVFGELRLNRCAFEAPVHIGVSACKLSCDRAHFLSRTTLEVRFAEVNLEDAEFAQPSVVAGSRERFKLDDSSDPLDDSVLESLCRVPCVHDPAPSPASTTPRISSLNRANVENLAVANINLESCRFSGAYNLDRLRFGEGVEFDKERRHFRTRRLVIDEETQFRRPKKHRDEAKPAAPDADRIARAYRALRKGREDNKNEPGAADFYYGEMEMRRKAANGFDRVLLPGYWMTSGYGLRAWRSLAALAVTVALFAWGFQAWGFDPDAGYWKSLLFSAESTTSLFRPPSLGTEAGERIVLTDAGHVLQMGLRLLGPLFFALALLALRGRVKR